MTSVTAAPAREQMFAGIDTHKSTHHVAVIDAGGQLVTDQQFATTAAGCRTIADWLQQFPISTIGIEQTGTYGVGVTGVLATGGYRLIDVNHPDLTVRSRVGKSDPIDAAMAAEAVRTGRAQVVAKDRSAEIEAIRFIHTARASAVKARSAALTQIASLAITVDPALRDRLGSTSRQIAATAATFRPNPTGLKTTNPPSTTSTDAAHPKVADSPNPTPSEP